MNTFNKLKVAIIGANLPMKSSRSNCITCSLFAGRHSVGIKKANSLRVPISDPGIEAIVDDPKICDLVFDCTSAQAHGELAYFRKIRYNDDRYDAC